MRICVLLSSYEGPGEELEELRQVATVLPQPGGCTADHIFEYRWICKHTAEKQIDALAAEKFDFYINLMCGTVDDPIAGAFASRYFESLGLPSCGIPSRERAMTKTDFFKIARSRGAPPVPGTGRFPLVVQPAKGIASQLSHKKVICHDQLELDVAISDMSNALYEARLRRAEHEKGFVDSDDLVWHGREDIVFQEVVNGQDYTVTIVEMAEACLALAPVTYYTKETAMQNKFSTFQLKLEADTCFELVRKEERPALYVLLQMTAIDGFLASGCRGGNMGCKVDIRVTPDGGVFVMDVSPQPAEFLPESQFQDFAIMHSLPGGHSALINIFIANHMVRKNVHRKGLDAIAGAYNEFASEYDATATSSVEVAIRDLANEYDFDGTVFDLGCGTGIFGRMLAERNTTTGSQKTGRLIGFDISPQMLAICRDSSAYDAVHIESMEAALINCRRYAESIDHIVCLSAIHFLSPEMFSFVLVLCFALANKSITINIDEIPDSYNDHLEKINRGFMHSRNHLASMEAFGEPPGWRLTRGKSQYSWTSPATGDDVNSTYFRFDRVGDAQSLIFRDPEFTNQFSRDTEAVLGRVASV
ncbi:hypothetical protein BJX61DRAFT_540217 [Aspergillus egyptiacus]|nr:hypothetical protein BJX61DRAFT_540217 [Aspergillus egyptiacus]